MTDPTPIEEAAFDRLMQHVTAEDIETAFWTWTQLCALAETFGVNTMDDLAACILIMAEQHDEYPAFQAKRGGGFVA